MTVPARPGTEASTLAVPGVDVVGSLGRGGFAAVYRGRHRSLDVDVAVKIVDGRVGEAPTFEKALREARFMARLDHPNLLRIYDAGRLGETIYLVLEFMDGGSLAGLHQMPADQLLDTARQLLSGLQALHDAGMVHRDIKPANCLGRQRDGRVKLADLGLAITVNESTRNWAGTLPFMAPELFADPSRPGPKADLYALGLTIACLALAVDPYPKDSYSEIVKWATSGPRPRLAESRPDLAPTLSSLVERLLSADPDDRPAAGEALAALAGTVPPAVAVPSARPAPIGARVGPWVTGAQVHDGRNWQTYVVTHERTGAAGRLMLLRADGLLGDSGELVLASAERASRLDHPGILPVLDWGTHGSRVYVVTGPHGRFVNDLVESAGRLAEHEALEIVAALAEALDYLHERELVYQVVAPDSVHIAPDGRSVQLAWPNFCVPRGSPAVTPEGRALRVVVTRWAAPEAFEWESRDPARRSRSTIEPPVDIYGLGQMLYYLLVGKPAHTEHGPHRLLAAKLAPIELGEDAPEVTRPTARLLADLLRPRPEQRPPTARAVRDEALLIARRLTGSR